MSVPITKNATMLSPLPPPTTRARMTPPSSNSDPQTPARPSMRRKSSAQNLLSSFKSSSSSSSSANNSNSSTATSSNTGGNGSSSNNPVAGPTASTTAATTNSIQGHAPHPPLGTVQQQQQPGAAPTPSALPAPAPAATATPPPREWDAQSLHDAAGPFLPPPGGAGAGSSPGATVEYLRDLVQKRTTTLTYMRDVHDGRSHWFRTIIMSRTELDRVFNNTAMKKRTHRFAILAMSLSSISDISQPTDFLRAALNMLTEYDQAKEENDRPKMRLWKRPSKRHTGVGVGDYALGMPDTSDTYLTIPHMPFPLDYTQTLLSLLDILSAFYAKLAKLLGPSPFPHASQHMLGLSPHPGVSYLFQNQTPATATDESLWNVALGSTPLGGGAGPGGPGGVLSSPPPSWTPSLGEVVLKVDGKFKKIISVLLKDLDVFARNSIKDELASLDPLLRNVGPWGVPAGTGDEGGRVLYEFDP
ncbi:hypothetical protein BJV78DRAFT_1178735 [Lactifluus subvellereus]|nr:hypothetical protein BJV78DRAFT_1178735 [Lactifluus subvellereus]